MEQNTHPQGEDKSKGGWELKPEIIAGFIGVVILIIIVVLASTTASPTSNNAAAVSKQNAPSETHQATRMALGRTRSTERSCLRLSWHSVAEHQ